VLTILFVQTLRDKKMHPITNCTGTVVLKKKVSFFMRILRLKSQCGRVCDAFRLTRVDVWFTRPVLYVLSWFAWPVSYMLLRTSERQ